MTLILKDQNQINPKSVWLKFEEADDYIELFLVHRDSGELVSENLPFNCGKLPAPLTSWFNQQREAWGFLVPDGMTAEEAVALAKSVGFREGPEDVAVNGDPGYVAPGESRREKVFSARRRIGRPGETPLTVIMAVAACTDENGYTQFERLPQNEIPWGVALHEDRTEEIFLTFAAPGEVERVWSKAGFVTRSDVVGCFEPGELYFYVRGNQEDGLSVCVIPIEDLYMDDDLRDHSLTVMPAAMGENLCENEWEIVQGVSLEEASSQMRAAGFVSMPDELVERWF